MTTYFFFFLIFDSVRYIAIAGRFKVLKFFILSILKFIQNTGQLHFFSECFFFFYFSDHILTPRSLMAPEVKNKIKLGAGESYISRNLIAATSQLTGLLWGV